MNQKAMDTKIFKLLAYIPFMWLVGFLCPYRNDSDVRFHVGQGITLNALVVVMVIVIELLINLVIIKIFSVEQVIFGVKTGIYVVTTLGIYISCGLRVIGLGVYLYYAMAGIKNVLNKNNDKLPYIGDYTIIR